MIGEGCDLLCSNKATRRFGKLFICESCAGHPEDQCGIGFSDVRGNNQGEKISPQRPETDGCTVDERAVPTKMPRRLLYSREDLADARRFLSNMRPHTSWDWDEEEFMASAANRLYDVRFVGRFAQRIDWSIATYHARVEKANRLAKARESGQNLDRSL